MGNKKTHEIPGGWVRLSGPHVSPVSQRGGPGAARGSRPPFLRLSGEDAARALRRQRRRHAEPKPPGPSKQVLAGTTHRTDRTQRCAGVRAEALLGLSCPPPSTPAVPLLTLSGALAPSLGTALPVGTRPGPRVLKNVILPSLWIINFLPVHSRQPKNVFSLLPPNEQNRNH